MFCAPHARARTHMHTQTHACTQAPRIEREIVIKGWQVYILCDSCEAAKERSENSPLAFDSHIIRPVDAAVRVFARQGHEGGTPREGPAGSVSGGGSDEMQLQVLTGVDLLQIQVSARLQVE